MWSCFTQHSFHLPLLFVATSDCFFSLFFFQYSSCCCLGFQGPESRQLNSELWHVSPLIGLRSNGSLSTPALANYAVCWWLCNKARARAHTHTRTLHICSWSTHAPLMTEHKRRKSGRASLLWLNSLPRCSWSLFPFKALGRVALTEHSTQRSTPIVGTNLAVPPDDIIYTCRDLEDF